MRLAIFILLLGCLGSFGQAFTLQDTAFLGNSIPKAAAITWAPTNAYGWWHADSITANNGDLISHWPDSAAIPHDLWVYAQDSATYSPYFTNNCVNSKPAMYWTGTPKGFTNAFGSTLAQPLTYFIVAQRVTGQANYVFHGVTGTELFAIDQATLNTSLGGLYAGTAWQESSTPCPTNSWCVYTICFNGASSFLRTNGVSWLEVSSTPGSGGNSSLCLGANSTFTFYGFKGWIAELIMYKGSVATNDMQWVEINLKTKYGL